MRRNSRLHRNTTDSGPRNATFTAKRSLEDPCWYRPTACDGESARKRRRRPSFYPASPAAIGVTGGNGQVVGIAGQTTLVPEPETWAMLLVGIGLVAVKAVRRR